MEITKIYNEDCLVTMKKMPDNFVDLVLTSPPYDDLRNYNGYKLVFENVAKELFRIIKKGGVVIWVVGDKTDNGSESGTSFKQALFKTTKLFTYTGDQSKAFIHDTLCLLAIVIS